MSDGPLGHTSADARERKFDPLSDMISSTAIPGASRVTVYLLLALAARLPPGAPAGPVILRVGFGRDRVDDDLFTAVRDR